MRANRKSWAGPRILLINACGTVKLPHQQMCKRTYAPILHSALSSTQTTILQRTLRSIQIRNVPARAYAVTIQNRIVDILYYHKFSNEMLITTKLHTVH